MKIPNDVQVGQCVILILLSHAARHLNVSRGDLKWLLPHKVLGS